MAAEETIKFPTGSAVGMTPGSTGLPTQLPGGVATVSALASATGGVRPGGMIETD